MLRCLLPKCPDGHFYDEETRGYVPYVAHNVNRGGVQITNPAGWVQKMNPLEALRRTAVGADAGTVRGVKDAAVKRRPVPASIQLQLADRVERLGLKWQRCEYGHSHRIGEDCQACTARFCQSTRRLGRPCGIRIIASDATECSYCRNAERSRRIRAEKRTAQQRLWAAGA